MKTKLITIIGAEKSDAEKANEIIALVVAKKGRPHSCVDRCENELTAYREVLKQIGNLKASEASISPKLMLNLCLEMERRAEEFGAARATDGLA
jgi:hypothetical protein